jgi:CBS domain containing-hemolysin-like protein
MDIFIMVLCILLSAFFSAAETAFSSVNKIKLISLAEGGSKRAASVLDTVERFDKFLTTILIGNNIVNILLATVAAVFFVERVSPEYGTTLSTAAVTLVVLVFGEITPKTLAKGAPERFSMATVPVVRVLIVLFTPINFIFSLWTKLLSKLRRPSEEPSITDDELITIVNEAYNEGGLDENESELIRNAIVFDDRQAEDILTPRVDVVAVSIDADLKEISEVFSETGYSRLPVYDGSLDNIIGVIHQKDFYEEILEGKKRP